MLSDTIIDRPGRRINLCDQGDVLDSSVLELLRGALQFNSFFTRLSLSRSRLSEDCITMLSALLKDPNYIEVLDLDSCQLRDRELNLHLASSLTAPHRLTAVDLSRNPELTDGAVDTIVEMIQQLQLRELRLAGLTLTRTGGERIVAAMQDNGSLEVCELPYTVGYEVLDRVSLLLLRNIRRREQVERQERDRQDFFRLVEENPHHTQQRGGLTRSQQERVDFARYYGYGRKNALQKTTDSFPVARALQQPQTTSPQQQPKKQPWESSAAGPVLSPRGWSTRLPEVPSDPRKASAELRNDPAISRSLQLLCTLEEAAASSQPQTVHQQTASSARPHKKS